MYAVCCAESGCRPVKNKTVSVEGPNGVQCHSVVEECSCTGGCYRMSYLETVYDYTDVSDNDTGSSPDVMVSFCYVPIRVSGFESW